MSQVVRRAVDAVRLIREGHIRRVGHSLIARFRSDKVSLGLARDVSVPLAAAPAKVPLEVRPLRPGEALEFLALNANVDAGDAAFALVEQRLLDSDFGTCYVAVNPEGKPCYMQFLFLPQDNPGIRQMWGNSFPTLGVDEALLEGAFTPDAYRGQGIMAHAMARIAEAAKECGARRVMTFVAADNIASLKGCKKAGFFPYLRRTESWRWGQRRITFEPLPEGTPYSFEEAPPNVSAAASPGVNR